MSVERTAGGTSLIDVLDRVLDKGIVMDAWVRVSLVGIDLITVEARVVVASIHTYLKYSDAVGKPTPVSQPATDSASLRFGSVASSRSALQRDDDDDDGGPGGSGSGGAPAVLAYPLEPRLRHPSRRSQARVTPSSRVPADMPNDHARVLGEALATAVVLRIKDHVAWALDLGGTTRLSSSEIADHRFNGGDSPGLSDELQFLSAFTAAYAVDMAFASNPQYKSEVLREFRTHYLELQDDEDRSDRSALLEDRFALYQTALRTRRAHEREEDVLAKAFADVCGRTEYDYFAVASDIVAQELILMRGVIRRR